jgi:hypothetical protein
MLQRPLKFDRFWYLFYSSGILLDDIFFAYF